MKLVNEKIVKGWDDPRLYTLIALRRRGIPPGAILDFVYELGCTTSGSVVSIKRFEQSVRKYLERTVPRLYMVLDPLAVVIEDADDLDEHLTIPFSLKDPSMGSRDLKLSKTVYIDRADFREEDDPTFFRLAPGKTVGLLQMPFPIRAVSYTKDDKTGKVKEVRAVLDREAKKPKAYIQWVPTEEAGSRRAEVRVYKPLFTSNNPGVGADWLSHINHESEIVYPNALVESGFEEVRRRAPWPEAAGEDKLGKGGLESVRFQGYVTRTADGPHLTVRQHAHCLLRDGHGYYGRQARAQPDRCAEGGRGEVMTWDGLVKIWPQEPVVDGEGDGYRQICCILHPGSLLGSQIGHFGIAGLVRRDADLDTCSSSGLTMKRASAPHSCEVLA